MSNMIHTLLVLPSVPSFVVLPVVGAFNIGTSSLSLLAVVDDGVAANEGVPSVPFAMVKVVDMRVVISPILSSALVSAVLSNVVSVPTK